MGLPKIFNSYLGNLILVKSNVKKGLWVALIFLFGSFLTLATYRIPLNQDITHERSYCPNCNHKLSFFDLIPIFSYLFLGGKCRYCKKKISPRYLIIEVLTGLSFVVLALALNIHITNITNIQIIEFIIGVLYIIFLFLIGGIDKEHNKIDKRVLIYGVVIALTNIIYQYISCEKQFMTYNINRIAIYLVIIIILNMINIMKTKQSKKVDYTIDLVILIIIVGLFTYEVTAILTIVCTLLIIAFKLLINKIMNKRKKYNKKMPIAFYIAISNAIIVLISFSYLLGK